MPSSVEVLDSLCFCQCRKLSIVTFREPSSVRRIGQAAFKECVIQKVSIPGSVQVLEEHSFYSCRELLAVEFSEPSALKRIGIETFAECALIQDVHVPATVE